MDKHSKQTEEEEKRKIYQKMHFQHPALNPHKNSSETKEYEFDAPSNSIKCKTEVYVQVIQYF